MTARPGSMPVSKLVARSPIQAVHRPINKSVVTWRSILLQTQALLIQDSGYLNHLSPTLSSRNLAQVRPEPLSELWFTSSFRSRSQPKHENDALDQITKSTTSGPVSDHKPPDERTVKLGKTLRALSPLLPTIFTTPIPNEILSSNVSLHLFPSTHPHLPVVKTRVPCRAALWTAPVAWGSVPIVGNVKIEVMSEKIVRTGYVSAPLSVQEECDGLGEEKLVVRWKSEGKKNGDSATTTPSQSLSSSGNEINRGLSTLLGGSQPLFSKGSSEPFTGLFIFSFDREGKIASMTIEHADESNGFDKTSKVVTLADWLLGRARWGRAEGGLVPGLAYKEAWCRDHSNSSRKWDRRQQ